MPASAWPTLVVPRTGGAARGRLRRPRHLAVCWHHDWLWLLATAVCGRCWPAAWGQPGRSAAIGPGRRSMAAVWHRLAESAGLPACLPSCLTASPGRLREVV